MRRVIVFSVDTIRGNIVTRKLSYDGFTPQLLNCATATIVTLTDEQPQAFVCDTSNCFPDELRLLLNCCSSLLKEGKINIILLGAPTLKLPWIVNQPGAHAQFLSDPLDPEAITTAVTTCFTVSMLPTERYRLTLHPIISDNLQPIATTTTDLEVQLTDFLRLR